MLNVFKKKEYPVEVLISTLENEDEIEVTEQDIQKVRENDTETFYKIGEAYYKKKNRKKAFSWYYKAALQEHAEAQAQIGIMYRMGWGVPSDFIKAIDWSMKAASNGSAKGQYSVGFTYSNGYGVPRDYKKAMDWCLKAANNGCADAMFFIGSMYRSGQGVTESIPTTIEWYIKAANQGHYLAPSSLGCFYRYTDGYKDLQKAVNWYQKAADEGDSPSKVQVKELNELGYYAKEEEQDKGIDQVMDVNSIRTSTIENLNQKVEEDLDNSKDRS